MNMDIYTKWLKALTTTEELHAGITGTEGLPVILVFSSQMNNSMHEACYVAVPINTSS